MSAISYQKLNGLVHYFVATLGLPSTYSDSVMYIYDKECPKFHRNGELFYTIEMEYPYRGLGQFSDVTWDSLHKKYPEILDVDHKFIGVPEFDIKATIALIIDSQKYHMNVFGEEILGKNNVIYLYHNQGAAQAKDFLLSGNLVYPNQSKAALKLFSEINRGNYS